MRQTISGLIAAIAVVTASAMPAMACGGRGLFGSSCSPCGEAYIPCAQPQAYVAPVFSGCNTGCGGWGGWGHERLPDPAQQFYLSERPHQYFYVDQGPTFTGPGNWAPLPTYQEAAVSGWDAYSHNPYHYGYDGGRYANATNHYYDGAPNVEGPAIYSYHAHPHFRPYSYFGPRYGYAQHYYGHHVLRRYY